MSSFGGKMEEIPQISIDNFDYNNLSSEAYFLSHCHSDHMHGLYSNYRTIFIEQDKYLYASEISCLILRKQYPEIRDKLKPLDMYSPTYIPLNDEIISVTPISAGHCPGSIMFLFETTYKKVLYSGDYRIKSTDLRKLKGFYDSSNKLKVIDNLYLDTTFLLQKYKVFPPRNEVVDELCETIESWIKDDKKNMINLSTPSPYGYEFLFLEIYQRLHMPIHLNKTAYDLYKYFPDLDKATTTDGNATQIHSYCAQHTFRICKLFDVNVKTIRVSAMRWKNSDSFSIKTENETTYVCYSTHASFEEGLEFIKFLKPRNIVPCVKQYTFEDNGEMNVIIKDLLQEIHGTREIDSCTNESAVVVPSRLQNLDERACSNLVSSSTNTSEYGLLDSPPRMSQLDDSLLDSPPRKMSK